MNPRASTHARNPIEVRDGPVTIIQNSYVAAPDELRPLAYWLEAFELPEATVRRWIRRGILPAVEAGRGGTIVRRSDLLAVVERLAKPRAPLPAEPSAAYAELVEQAKGSKR